MLWKTTAFGTVAAVAFGASLLLATPATATTQYESILPYSVDVFPTVHSDKGRMFIEGNGNTNLDCVVHAPDGQLLALDRGPTDACVLIWDQLHLGPVSVEVTNLGPLPNRYKIEWE